VSVNVRVCVCVCERVSVRFEGGVEEKSLGL
jgi:hypothetical protein